ncbi:MAG: PEP-CTERM sorting domain-containing protein [Verrucomicrobiales bacterium]
MKTLLSSLAALALTAAASPAANVFLSEFHYDNAGGDTGEFIEVYALVGTLPGDISVVLYNGSGGASYGTFNGSSAANIASLGSATVGASTYDIYYWDTPGLQNGAPDGIAVSDGVMVEFWSYEGSFTASGGIANGLTSTDVGVLEPGDTPGTSITKDFVTGGWSVTNSPTLGTANPAVPEPAAVALAMTAALGFVARRRR